MKVRVVQYIPEMRMVELMITTESGTVEREFDLPALEFILGKFQKDRSYLNKINLDEYERALIELIDSSGGYEWFEDKLDSFIPIIWQ